MAALQFQTASIYAFYPTLLKTVGGYGPTGVFVGIGAYSIGSIVGKLSCGQIAHRIGDRLTVLGCLCVTLAALFPFAGATSGLVVMGSAFVIGASSSGVFALVPHYLSERFSNAVRSFGMGLAYAVAAAGQAIATYVLPATGKTLGLVHAIEIFVVGSTIAIGLVAFREVRDLPGRDMDAVPAE